MTYQLGTSPQHSVQFGREAVARQRQAALSSEVPSQSDRVLKTTATFTAAAQWPVLSCPGPLEESLCFQFVWSYNPTREEAEREGTEAEVRGGKATGLLSWLWGRKTFPLNLNHKLQLVTELVSGPHPVSGLGSTFPARLSLILIGLLHQWKWWIWWQKVTGWRTPRVIETNFATSIVKKALLWRSFFKYIYFAKSFFHILKKSW